MTYDEAIRQSTLSGVVLKYDTVGLTVSATLNGKTVTVSYETVSRRDATVTAITEVME